MSRRRLGNVIQSYKQVKMVAPASHAAATQVDTQLSVGVDNYTGPSAANNEVPTGAKIEHIDIQVSGQNLVNVASFMWITIQEIDAGAASVPGRAQGGNTGRNKVFFTKQMCIGQNQNVNCHIPFKIPPKFQRVVEGRSWYITIESDTIWTDAITAIYKFYR